VCHAHAISTTLDAELDAPFKAIPCVCDIVEIFVVSSEPKPGGRVPSSCSSLKVAEGSARVVLQVFWVGAAGGESSPEIKGLCNVGRNGCACRICVLGGGYLEDQGYGNLDEPEELGVVNDGWADKSVGRGGGVGALLVYEEEDVSCPGELEGGIMIWALDGLDCGLECRDGGHWGCQRGNCGWWGGSFRGRTILGCDRGMALGSGRLDWVGREREGRGRV
jgi:hypothetical protein